MITGAAPRLYNSLGRKLADFQPMEPGRVRLYTCGPTVYAYAHLGNMRPYVFSDTLRRYLEWKGLEVIQVVNITDVGHTVGDDEHGEDKVEVAARREQRSVWEVTKHYAEAFFRDIADLNVQHPTHTPLASSYVPKMIEFAKVLHEKGYTYQIADGLYFDTERSQGYGRLALISMAGQQEGARMQAVVDKRSKADFAVWRTERGEKTRIVHWDSPWGPGVPGWHLECSVMSMDLLGEHFDIHTGGVDHREIHHVNEIAQSEAYLGDGRDWVPLWMHNEFLLVGSQKISKSAGRMPLLSDLIESGIHPMAYRYFLLTAHYRQQLDFTPAAIDAAATALRRLLGRVATLGPLPEIATLEQLRSAVTPAALPLVESIDEAVSEDLNTPKLLALLNEALRGQLPDADKAALAATADTLLGLRLGELTEDDLAPAQETSVDADRIEALIQAREDARRAKNWAEADRVRDELTALGIKITDTPDGPRWSVAVKRDQ